MGAGNFHRVAMQAAAAAGLIWLGGVAQGQGIPAPADCAGLGSDWQTIEVSGQTAAAFTANGGRDCAAAPCQGQIFVCFNPKENCYLAVSGAPLAAEVPFTAEESAGGIHAASGSTCGGRAASDPDIAFDVMISSTGTPGCLNKLGVSAGKFEGGELLDTSTGPAVMIATDPPVLIDMFVGNNSLKVPGFHDLYSFEVQVPLAGDAISVRNQDTGQAIGGGSVSNSCGAQLPPPKPIPTLPQYALILLIMGLLFAVVRVARRGMSA